MAPTRPISTPSFLCLSQESSRRASARREESFQPKDLGWLDPCDKHRDEER
ncbi:integrase [Agrobacterium fabrum]|nr:integrase [Agrobacterium fabrum]TRB29759.1 integrase [Agrobacterium fabrum]